MPNNEKINVSIMKQYGALLQYLAKLSMKYMREAIWWATLALYEAPRYTRGLEI